MNIVKVSLYEYPEDAYVFQINFDNGAGIFTWFKKGQSAKECFASIISLLKMWRFFYLRDKELK